MNTERNRSDKFLKKNHLNSILIRPLNHTTNSAPVLIKLLFKLELAPFT